MSRSVSWRVFENRLSKEVVLEAGPRCRYRIANVTDASALCSLLNGINSAPYLANLEADRALLLQMGSALTRFQKAGGLDFTPGFSDLKKALQDFKAYKGAEVKAGE